MVMGFYHINIKVAKRDSILTRIVFHREYASTVKSNIKLKYVKSGINAEKFAYLYILSYLSFK